MTLPYSPTSTSSTHSGLSEGAAEVGATDQVVGEGGRGCPDLGKDLCGRGP